MSTKRVCIYCDGPAVGNDGTGSREHAIPKWIPAYFGLEREILEHNRAVGVPKVDCVRFDDLDGDESPAALSAASVAMRSTIRPPAFRTPGAATLTRSR